MIEEALLAIEELNSKLYDMDDDNNKHIHNYSIFYTFMLHIDGNSEAIDFAGIELWCSENDDRSYDKNDDREPLAKFVLNKLDTILSSTSKLISLMNKNG
jgi:hypothetical protein